VTTKPELTNQDYLARYRIYWNDTDDIARPQHVAIEFPQHAPLIGTRNDEPLKTAITPANHPTGRNLRCIA
jgi:hypothetical protein